MSKAVVLGKFMPLHKGHLALIEFALTVCDNAKVLVLIDSNEPSQFKNRTEYFDGLLKDKIEVVEVLYDSVYQNLCNTNEPKEEYAKRWVGFLKSHIKDCTHVITSEIYGENIAKYSHLKHVCFDVERKLVPISATEIRNNHCNTFYFMSQYAQRLNQKLVFILGTESTGKSTMVEKLADYFKCKYVEEAGRRLVESSTTCTEDIFEVIAKTHNEDIQKAINIVPYTPYIFIDTDWCITQSYAKFLYDKEIHYIEQDGLRFYLSKDVPFIQDGTRLTELDRNRLDESHRAVLKEHGIGFIEITETDYDNRFETIKNNLL